MDFQGINFLIDNRKLPIQDTMFYLLAVTVFLVITDSLDPMPIRLDNVWKPGSKP
jgi:hypothetical protein